MTNKKLLKDLAKLTEFHHTGELESYHSLTTKYAPKHEYFCYWNHGSNSASCLGPQCKREQNPGQSEEMTKTRREKVQDCLWQAENELR